MSSTSRPTRCTGTAPRPTGCFRIWRCRKPASRARARPGARMSPTANTPNRRPASLCVPSESLPVRLSDGVASLRLGVGGVRRLRRERIGGLQCERPRPASENMDIREQPLLLFQTDFVFRLGGAVDRLLNMGPEIAAPELAVKLRH